MRHLPFILALLGLILFTTVQNPAAPTFLGFTELKWSSLDGWRSGWLGPDVLSHSRAVTFLPRQSFERWTTAVSEPFVISGPTIVFQTLGPPPPGRFAVELRSIENPASPTREPLFKGRPKPTSAAGWSSMAVEVPPALQGQTVTATFIAEQPKVAPADLSKRAFSIRDRVSFFSARAHTTYSSSALWLAAISAAILLIYLAGSNANLSFSSILPLYLLLIAAAFIRTSLYFHWDEWDVLHRLVTEPISTVLRPHNEHFIPLFFLFYKLESVLFGSFYLGYLLVTASVHAINSVLLARLLRKITPDELAPPAGVYWAIGGLYALNVLHAEVMQWAFEISIALLQTVLLLCCYQAVEFIRDGKRPRLATIFGLAAVAPLIFGNGLILPIQIGVVATIPLICRTDRSPLLVQLQRLITAGVVALLPCIGAFLAYRHFSPPSGAAASAQASLAANIPVVIDYLFVGTGLGAILRSTGAFSTLAIDGSSAVLHWWIQRFPSIVPYIQTISPEDIFAAVGILLALGVLIFGVKIHSKEARRWQFPLACFISGLGFIVVTMALPAIGRWQLGVFQSLSPRYHYQTLPGVMLLTLPLLIAGFNQVLTRTTRPAMSAVLALVLLVHLYLQFSLTSGFDYFTTRGAANQRYVQELADWQVLRTKSSTDSTVPPFDGAGTWFADLYPLSNDPLAPGMAPETGYEVLNKLNPSKFPVVR